MEQNKLMLSESAIKSAIEEIKGGEELMKCLSTHLNPHSDEYSDLSAKILQSLSTALHLLVPQEAHTSCAIQGTNNGSLSLEREKQTKDKVPNKRRRHEDSSKSICVTMAPHYDGYKWRKYGEKRIQNSAYPRTYYRCTHKDEGCLATKKIQQQDGHKYSNDSPMFQVIYENKHSCSSSSISNDEYVFYHHDQSSFTGLEGEKSSLFCNGSIDSIIHNEQVEHNSSQSDIDQKLFTESSSSLKTEKVNVNCDSAMETNNFHMNPTWIPHHQCEPDYNYDLESLLSSFI